MNRVQNLPAKKFGERTQHGLRCNLGALEQKVDDLYRDLEILEEVKPRGYQRQIDRIEAEIAEVRGVYARAVQYGTGYYDTTVTQSRPWKVYLLLVVAVVIAFVVFLNLLSNVFGAV
jgi:hypothetical protein